MASCAEVNDAVVVRPKRVSMLRLARAVPNHLCLYLDCPLCPAFELSAVVKWGGVAALERIMSAVVNELRPSRVAVWTNRPVRPTL